jgi:multidrug efflux system membrane fusion protein
MADSSNPTRKEQSDPDLAASGPREPSTPVPTKAPHRAGSLVVRLLVAAAVVGAVVWYIKSRTHEHEMTAAEREQLHSGSGGSGHGRQGGDAPSARGSGGGSAERVVPVQAVLAEKKDVPVWLEGLGSVSALQQVTIHAQVDGRLDSVFFTEGQLVKKGDVIAQIDPRPFHVQLLSAQGALARDKAQYDANILNLKRYQDLQAQQLVAAQTVEQYQFQAAQYAGSVKTDQAAIDQANLQLDYAAIKAPLTGITGVRLVDAGNIVHATDATGLVVITAIDPAAVYFTVPQDKLSGVVEAQARGEVAVEVWSRDGATKIADGKLAVLDNQINQTTATLRLKAVVDNPKHILWPNAFVKARMLLETRPGAVVVPSVAVEQGPSGTFVYIIADGVAQPKPVTVALQTGEMSVIENGLSGGEQVITEGQTQLRPGGKVQVAGAHADAGSGSGSGASEHHGHKHEGSGGAQ